MAVQKKRNWIFVIYPESAPDDFKDILQLSGIVCAISPLHDKDINPDGELKKPHWHVIVCYGSPTTYNNVKSLSDRLNGAPPQALEQVRGYFRYFTHKDNPEKYQYNEADIVCINGFDIADFTTITSSELLEIKMKLLDIIEEYDFCEYQILVKYVRQHEEKRFFDVVSNHTIFFNTYLKSKRHGQTNRKDL